MGLEATAAGAQSPVLVAHLPSAPIESASRLAEAVTALAGYLSQEIPELDLEVQLFRHLADAESFLQREGDRVALSLTEASWLLDMEEPVALVPMHRLVRDGASTYRRLIVVRAGASDVDHLFDLRRRRLGVVTTALKSDGAFLAAAIFAGEIEPALWFESLEPMTDDFSATTAVLFEQTDAALIAEHNPLVQNHLEKGELRVVYESPPLSLPVLATRRGALDPLQLEALDSALSRVANDPQGRKFLTDLKVDGFEAIAPALQTAAGVSLPREPGKVLEIALPEAGDLELALPPRIEPTDLPFTLGVELPDVPLPKAIRERKHP